MREKLQTKSVNRLDKLLGREPVSFKRTATRREGSVTTIGKKDVVTIPPTMSIKSAAETMTRYRFRRLPITDPGSKRLLGMIGSSDIIDFLGGGKKYQLIAKKHWGNFLAAINEPVREIMTRRIMTLGMDSTIGEALSMVLSSRVGGLVIVDDKRRVTGMVTERDFVLLMSDKVTGKSVEDYMTRDVITASPGTTIGDISKVMTRNSFRRLPIVSEDRLVGIVTTRHLINFLGKNRVFRKIVENRVEDVLKVRVKEIMHKKVSKVGKSEELGTVSKIMEETGRGTVCIVDDGRLVGILTERDIVKAMEDS